jgi:hypothetical protein
MASSETQSQRARDVFLALEEWFKKSGAPSPDGRGAPEQQGEASPEIHPSPSIAANDLSFGLNSDHANVPKNGIPDRRASFGRRLFRTLSFGFVIVGVVAAALAWQANDQTTKDDIRARAISLVTGNDLLSHKPSDQAQVESPVQAESVSRSASGPNTDGLSTDELTHQLATVTNDIAAIRRIVEQLSAKQEQMAQDIATLQEAQQSKMQKTSSPLQASDIPLPPMRRVPRTEHSRAVGQSPSAPPLSQPVSAPLPLR